MDVSDRGKDPRKPRSQDSSSGAAARCPSVVPRQQWGAVAPRARSHMAGAAARAVIHHTALASCGGADSCGALVRRIQLAHMEGRGFDDIGYNFLIGGDGSVFEGRGWGIVGAHTKRCNADSLGIALMGHFSSEAPSPAALSAARQLLDCGVAQGHLRPDFTLLGHRDVGDTECPGDQLYQAMRQFANFKP
nr:PREDICTED: peptidoglycan-recognition protein SC2-like [Lepisosteus oculatus]XP_015196381.1 PREDICTED: peptidoglycan-recognition protein SC2-like [Lepisosteus oculatus]XP_015196382.1 PREDICTED: peptidoglycan-recognition protein SC2-like [Lepisosteus oculatus]XP_015196383.1 PREDICTED: peptidoglycan-recognition protein SC2-like [Lepisosteus oculatus]XP_015196384.1 PREDICTED: peptidoglycan-recognition protein SC2-like [Lepisosteus oculatus]XP_015196385.1 PREDICTED: peptidoglycan-recognition pro